MKKLLLSILLIAVPVAIVAQFKVKSDGSVLLGSSSQLAVIPSEVSY